MNSLKFKTENTKTLGGVQMFWQISRIPDLIQKYFEQKGTAYTCVPVRDILSLFSCNIAVLTNLIVLYLTMCHLGAGSSFKHERETNYK